MAIFLEPEQEKLFLSLRDAIDSTPREEREEFMFLRSFQADHLQGNGLELEVLYEDVIALEDAGLIRVTNRHKKGSGFNFVVPPSANSIFEEHRAAEAGTRPTSGAAQGPGRSSTPADPKAVMVVHGRNEQAREAMFGFLRRLGLKPLEWEELVAGTGSAAPYVGEVLDHAFARATAVVVLFTPDDEARLRNEFQNAHDEAHETDLTPQARPNVLFEAGMALAVHPTRTILVELGRLRPFSDIYGRHAVRLNGTDGPLRTIADRLEKAGCAVDLAGDDWSDPDQFPAPDKALPPTSALQRSGDATAREVGYLNEDARRWIADRNRQLEGEMRQRSGEMNAAGQFHSGAHLAGLSALKRQALHEYRDEMSEKRRRYARLVDESTPGTTVPRFELTDSSRELLAAWREPVKVAGMDQQGLCLIRPTPPMNRTCDALRLKATGRARRSPNSCFSSL